MPPEPLLRLSVVSLGSPQIQLVVPGAFGASSHRLSTWPTPGRSPTPFMASLLCCGPKLAACGIVLSAWGVIMLVRGLPDQNRRGPERPRVWGTGRLGDSRAEGLEGSRQAGRGGSLAAGERGN